MTKGNDILIIRISNSCKLKNSRPCDDCITKLKLRGIRKVYYSNEFGSIVCEYLTEMKNLHKSSGHKFVDKILHRSFKT